MADHNTLDVAIIGAGFAGLACAARLRALGIKNFAVFEQGSGVGAAWRKHYDRIRLHSPFHDLPDDGGLRRRYGLFLSRRELLDYFEAYAEHHALAPHLRFGQRVRQIAKERESWRLETDEAVHEARSLVVATAYNRKPIVPELPGRSEFPGQVIHSGAYRNADPYRGARALVIGSGNSAAEIALDLCEGGAASAALLIRAPRHVLSQKAMGRMAKIARLLRIELTPKHIARSHAYTRTHPEFRDKLREKDAFFGKFAIDLSEYGLEQPEDGPATEMYFRGRVPWMDQGTVAAVRDGRIEVIDAKREPLSKLTPSGVALGGRVLPCDLVVLGTGFEPGLDDLFVDADRLLYWNPDMGRRMPHTDGRSRSVPEPTLFFPGFDLSANGGLSLGLWGVEVADAISNARA